MLCRCVAILLGRINSNIFDPKSTNYEPITVPVHTRITVEYENILRTLDSDAAYLQSDYPGLFRVLNSCIVLFRNILNNNVKVARDERVWKNAFMYAFEQRERMNTIEKFRNFLRLILMADLHTSLSDSAQNDINDMREMLDWTVDAYLAQSDSRLYKLSKSEKDAALAPLSTFRDLSGDLREALTCLRSVLDEKHLANYTERLGQIVERNRGPKQRTNEEDND